MDAGGLRLAVHEWGPEDGTPVLLAHGSFDFARTFDGFAPLLAEAGLRVVSWDQRGHGDSEHAALYSWAADVCDARAVLDSTSAEPVHAVGHSKGGSVLTALIQALPHRFLRFVNIDGIPAQNPATTLSEEQQAQLLAAGIAGWLDGRAELRDGPRRGRSLDELARGRQSMNPRLPLDWLRYLAHAGAREEEDGWRWKLDPFLRTAAFGPSRPEWELQRLHGLAVPLLALFGLVPEPMGWGASEEALAPYLPDGARVATLADAGHFVHMEQPERVAEHVLDFLS
ncbi:MAG: alpha/beta hydrolase [Myxococcota bacterium]|nr:alpha/beta hydrolase [Myxococcota bacterium]